MYGDKWKARSLAVKRAANFQCEYVYSDGKRCAVSVLLNTHHVTYERFGHERGTDLVCLCRLHHMKVHGLLPRIAQ